MSNRGISYRRDIDGLRSVAIIPVVLFHAFPSLVPGGFVGVDVFFVISGFLISGIIFSALKSGSFSFYEFYARRICRIFPALMLVLAFCLIVGWLALLPDEYKALGKHVRGGALYISNFVLKGESGYFNTAAELKPLLHLWSLAIEEQFYIFWPLAAVIAFRMRLNLFFFIVFLLVASFVYNLVLIAPRPVDTFFLPLTRVWELLTGALLAQVNHFGWWGRGDRPNRLGINIPVNFRAASGLAAIAVSVALLDKDTVFPGWWASLPVAGTALLISAGPSAWINRTVLAHPAMVFVGLISYPLYLWHWPLLSIARIIWGVGLTPLHVVGLVVLSVVLAYLTYRLVEVPIRFGRGSRLRTAFILGAVCFAIGLGGQAVTTKNVLPYASRFGVDRIMAAAGEWDYPGSLEQVVVNGRNVWRRAGQGRGAVLLLGDSNVEQYAPRVKMLAETYPEKTKTALFLTSGGCPPIPAVFEEKHAQCPGLTDTAMIVADKFDVDTVVISAQWSKYFLSPVYKIDGAPLRDATAWGRAMESFGSMIAQLSAKNRRVFVVLNIPTGGEVDPKNQVERSFMSFTIKKMGIPVARLREVYSPAIDLLAEVSKRNGAIVVDPLDYLCGADGSCPAVTESGDPMYKDVSHLRPTYVRESVRYLDAALTE